jgi:hypothetical protein
VLSPDTTAVVSKSAGSRKRPVRANTSIEEQEIRIAVEAWGRNRFGDVRVIHELALGDRRIDMVFVCRDDIVGVEIKGPKDSLSDGRLGEQLREFNFYLPEVWLAVAPRWLKHTDVKRRRNLLLPTESGIEVVKDKGDGKFRPERDEYFCSRMIELLWVEEAARIAQRTDVIPGVTLTREPVWKVKRMLARMLSGHEIVKQVCLELRARPLVGLGSDRPMRALSR